MEKKKTPAITIIFYVIGILLLAIAAFMLVTAISYTTKYVASYGATFADMWSNSIQYIIAQFVPYLGMGVICIGLGKAINLFQVNKGERSEEELEPEEWAAAAAKKQEGGADFEALHQKVEGSIKYLTENIEATREVLSIKIEEKEKRDAYRLQEMGRDLEAAIEALEGKGSESIVIEEPSTSTIEDPTASTIEEPIAPTSERVTPKPVRAPQLFRIAASMAMPAICKVESKAIIVEDKGEEKTIEDERCEADEAYEKATVLEDKIEEEAIIIEEKSEEKIISDEKALAEAPEVELESEDSTGDLEIPQLFREAETMSMPDIPKVECEAEESESSVEKEDEADDGLLEIFMKNEKAGDHSFNDELPELNAFKKKETLSRDDLFEALNREE